MAWIYYLLLVAVMFVGLFLNLVGLPGLWLMVGAHAVYAWMTGWEHFVGWPSLIAMVVLAIGAEIVEFMAGAAGSSAAGGRKRGMVGAVIGGLIGAVFFTGLVPIPIVGTIIGVCLGTFIGAAVMEYRGKGAVHSLRVGVGAAKGRFWGIIGKSAFGIVMLVVAMIAALPVQFTTTVIPATLPATLPTTSPSSSTIAP
jgi:uncharacterized protein YqgC (DUF456 family)